MRREWMLHVLPPVGAACAGGGKPPWGYAERKGNPWRAPKESFSRRGGLPPVCLRISGGRREGCRGERSFPRPPEGEQSEPEGRAFRRKGHSMAFSKKADRNTGMFRRSISVRSRRVSEANLKVERLAQPISRTEHQHAVRRDGAKSANKPGGTPAHRRWVGAEQGESVTP